MDRSAALTYLTNEFSALASDAGLTAADTGAGYGQAIDMALRRLGYQESELGTADVDLSLDPGYVSLLDFYALRRFSRLVAARVDVQTGDPTTSLRRSQAFSQIQALLAQSEQEVKSLGLSAGQGQMQLLRINLDFLEPPLEE